MTSRIRRASLLGFGALAPWLLACSATQRGDEQVYIATRDGYRKSLVARGRGGGQNIMAADDSARRDLETRLRPVVGAFTGPGIVGPGRINIATLLPGDENSGLPDGILYESSDRRTRTFVSTDGLMRSWLAWLFEKDTAISRDPAVALRSPEVYTQIFDVDAAVNRYADIPVGDVERGGILAAMLVGRAQDICRCTPDEIIIGVKRGHRIFIVDAPARDSIPPSPACIAIWDAGGRRSEEIIAEYTRGHEQDKALLGRAFQAGVDAEAAYRRCYGEHMAAEPRFARVIAQAREIVSSLPAR